MSFPMAKPHSKRFLYTISNKVFTIGIIYKNLGFSVVFILLSHVNLLNLNLSAGNSMYM